MSHSSGRISANEPGAVLDASVLHTPGSTQSSRSEQLRDGRWRQIVECSWAGLGVTASFVHEDGRPGLRVSLTDSSGNAIKWDNGQRERTVSLEQARQLVEQLAQQQREAIIS